MQLPTATSAGSGSEDKTQVSLLGKDSLPDSVSTRKEEEQSDLSLANQVPVPYHELDSAGRIQQVNLLECRLLGFDKPEQIIGRAGWEFVWPEDRDFAKMSILKKLAGRQVLLPFTCRLQRVDGSSVVVEVHQSLILEKGRITGLRSVAIDQTQHNTDTVALKTLVAIRTADLTALELQLRQAQKMDAVGQLAGSVAHDFNNLLTVIQGYGSMLLEGLKEEDESRLAIEQILLTTNRASSLARQLLFFSRLQPLERRIVRLNEVISNFEGIAARLVGETYAVRTLLLPNVGLVHADPNQLEQILLNLLVNARDAMPNGGEIIIETGVATSGDEYFRDHLPSHTGAYVFFSVSDTGIGMDAETRAKIFEPFFTTKEVGKGTGLGLSTVIGIVKQHEGFVSVHSETNVGSKFKVYLPVVDAPPTADPPSQGRLKALLGGTETILLVEDDAAVRKLGRSMLERLGYHVIEAEDGFRALEQCKQFPGRIDLLLTDIVMPGLDGRKLSGKIAELRPDTPTLFCSGYPGETGSLREPLRAADAFLQKPYTPQAIAAAVRAILDR